MPEQATQDTAAAGTAAAGATTAAATTTTQAADTAAASGAAGAPGSTAAGTAATGADAGAASGATAATGATGATQSATATSAAPEKYDLKLPETPTLTQASIERTAAFAKARGLSQDAAQAALELANTEAAEVVKAQQQQLLDAYSPGDPTKNIPPGAEYAKHKQQWIDDGIQHPELGAGNRETYEAKLKDAAIAFEKFADTEIMELLHLTGYESHPAVVRLFAKIGLASKEGAVVLQGAQVPEPKSTVDVFYGPKPTK